MFKETYNRMNESIQPDGALNHRVLDRIAPKRLPLRPAAAVALVLAAVLLAVPVAAACVPSAWNRIQNLNFISPEAESVASTSQTWDWRNNWNQNLTLTSPEAERVANGIRMEVVGIAAEDSKARVLLRFEYEDGTPVQGIVKLGQVYFDAYHTWYLTGGGPYHTGTEELLEVGFTCREGGPEEFYGSQINLTVDSIRLTEKIPYEVPLTLTDSETITVPGNFIENAAVHDIFSSFGEGASEGHEAFHQQEAYTLIAPGEAVYPVTEQVGITGMCFIDDRLHIQVCQTAPYEKGYFSAWLEDAAGNRIYDYAWHDFRIGEGEQCIVGREYYFDISPEELDDYKLMVEVENAVEGPWKVSFELNE